MVFPAKHLHVAIERPPREVYAFMADVRNLPKWAAGLGASVARVDGEWTAESPMGRVKLRFAPKNDFGVLDHDVVLPSGETVSNPLRVIPNDAGSEVVFTLLQRKRVTDRAFEEDAAAVVRDLAALKALLEQ